MTNNYILRRLRFIFDYGDDQMIELFAMAGCTTDRAEVSNWLKKDEDPDFVPLKDQKLAYFLNGLIIKHRGTQNGRIPEAEQHLDNNDILRKLKIALSLRDDDMLKIFSLAGMEVSKHEVSAFFRKPTQRQYRECLDQFLRNFLHGLQVKHQGKTK